MARKKIVFVIVEGASEDTALGVLLNRIYDQNAVHIECMHGDITSDLAVGPSNIVARLGLVVKAYAEANHFRKEHFQEMIHLIDMDGAYIPDGNVVEDPSAAKPVYSLTDIRTAHWHGIIERNAHKRENIDRVCRCSKIWTLPYRAYFMSTNLDHVLYGKLNRTDGEKEDDSYGFVKKYKDHIPQFIDYMVNSDFSYPGGFHDSWDFIKDGLHSLERHSNFGMAFKATGGG